MQDPSIITPDINSYYYNAPDVIDYARKSVEENIIGGIYLVIRQGHVDIIVRSKKPRIGKVSTYNLSQQDLYLLLYKLNYFGVEITKLIFSSWIKSSIPRNYIIVRGIININLA